MFLKENDPSAKVSTSFPLILMFFCILKDAVFPQFAIELKFFFQFVFVKVDLYLLFKKYSNPTPSM